MRKLLNFLAVIVLASAAAPVFTYAQDSSRPNSSAGSQLTTTPASVGTNPQSNEAILGSLSSLPEADMLIYINPQRILNEVVPKIVPAKELEEMRKAFDAVQKNVGIDPTKVDYIVMAIRFRKPTAELKFQPPEALVVASGDFSAESLMVLARMASQGKLRDEKYGNKNLGLMTIDPIVKEAEKNPFLRAFTEVGIVTLSPNTIAAGSPAYLRTAIDAGDGKDRISSETLNSLVRDPNVLLSIAGRPWHSFAKSFGMLGTEANARAARCETKIGDFYAALTMDTTNFMLRGAMNEDNPDTARIVSNLVSGFLNYATSSMKDPAAQTMLKNLAITSEGDEVLLRADFPQQAVVNMIRERMKPKKADATSSSAPAPAPKPTKPKRKIRRRT